MSAIMRKLGNLEDEQEKIILKCRTLGVLEDLTLKKADIVFLQAEKTRRVTCKTIYSDYELLVKPLSEYAKLLDSPAFVPIMRCYLLNFHHVESIDGDSFVLAGGWRVPMGIKREVRKASMEKYLKFLQERF